MAAAPNCMCSNSLGYELFGMLMVTYVLIFCQTLQITGGLIKFNGTFITSVKSRRVIGQFLTY